MSDHEDKIERKPVDEGGPWAKTSSGNADKITTDDDDDADEAGDDDA